MNSLNLQQFIRNFANQFASSSNCYYTPDSIISECEGWSSIVALSLVSMIETEYGVHLSSFDLKKVTTIAELFSLVEQKHM